MTVCEIKNQEISSMINNDALNSTRIINNLYRSNDNDAFSSFWWDWGLNSGLHAYKGQ
jgi:hypothetical protein